MREIASRSVSSFFSVLLIESDSMSEFRPLVGIPLIQNHASGHAALGTVFPGLGTFTRRAIHRKAADTPVKHIIGYFFAAPGTFAFWLFHRYRS